MSQILTQRAKELRVNLTEAEKKVWNHLRSKQLEGLKFRRQQLIGKYIVYFVCFEKKIIVEIDGGQHADSDIDVARDNWFQSQGFQVLRFWNNHVFENLNGVIEKIRQILSLSPSPNPSHRGRGKLIR